LRVAGGVTLTNKRQNINTLTHIQMKTMLCPIDSSPRSDRLVHYVGDLARDTQSKIYLIPAQASARKELVLAGTNNDKPRHERLDELHDYLSSVKHVPCSIEEEPIAGNAYKKLGTIADGYDLMAMPFTVTGKEKARTKGLDLTKILHETLVPLLLVPDPFKYEKVKRLLYAYDYKHEPEPPLIQLHWLADWFEAEIRFISVLPSDISTKEQDKLISIHQVIGNSWKGNNKISFETIIYPDVPRCLEQYLSLREMNDLLVLSINHQNMLERFWHKSVVKGLLQYGKHPYLIIHR
jgi:hypothetical protein